MSQSKPTLPMISLRGSAALSPFRIEKIQSKLDDGCPNISHVYAEFWHFAWVDGALSVDQQNTLKQILTYGPSMQAEELQGELILVLPRVGTISPWASRATDIVKHCGLPEIQRVERGIAYTIKTKNGQPLTAAERQLLLPLIHDRMTESVFPALQDAAKLYHTDAPKPLCTVDILQGGKAALNQANSDMGLALSPDEVDYLFDNFSRMQRNPTDVELMMFAQANSEHCRHKIFNADWVIDGAQQEMSLFGMIRNTHKLNPGKTVVAYSDNASIVAGQKDGEATKRFYPTEGGAYRMVEEDMHYLMKVETHNHPTAISPFAGAATGAAGWGAAEGATPPATAQAKGPRGLGNAGERDSTNRHRWGKSLR